MLKSVQILIISENTHFRGKDHCTAGLQKNKIRFDQERKFTVISM